MTQGKNLFSATIRLLVQLLFASFLASPAFSQAKSIDNADRITLHHKTLPPRHHLGSSHRISAERKLIGQYVYANGVSGLVLDLFDNRNYRLFLHSSAVEPSDLNDERNKSFGTWRLNKEDNLVLTPQDSKRRLRYLSHPTTFFPVHWGMRTYLLSETDFSEFKKAIASGQEPRHESWGNAFFLLSLGDEKKPAKGSPVFPERWRDKNKSIAPIAEPIIKTSSKS